MRTLGLSSRFRESSVACALTLAIFGTELCDPAEARIITFDPPGADATYPSGINASGWITGSYGNNNGDFHSFLRAPDGTFTTFDVSGATCGTYAESINRSGVIVGGEQDNCNDGHGFVRASDGTITAFDVPGSIYTWAVSVNNAGLITGSYEDSSNLWHGYLRATD